MHSTFCFTRIYSDTPPNTVHLFPSEKTGEALGERMVQLIVQEICGDGENQKTSSPHDLRHRFGYRLAETNTPISPDRADSWGMTPTTRP